MYLKTALTGLAIAAAAQPALALTCLRPSVERAFLEARDATEAYVPVVGRFTGFPERPDDQTIDGPDRNVPAQFTGHTITGTGLGQPVDIPVALVETCLGSWCPAFAPDEQVVTFLRREGDGYELRVDACHGNYFPADADTLGAMQACLREMDCTPAE